MDAVTEQEAAKMLGVAPRTLRSWRAKKVGPAFVRVGHRIHYPREALLTYLTDRVVFPEEQQAA